MKENFLQQIKLTFKLFTNRDVRIIRRIIILQTFFNILDLFGVALIGVVGALAVRGVKSQTIGDRTSIVLKTAHMENLSLPEQITIIGAIAVEYKGCEINR